MNLVISMFGKFLAIGGMFLLSIDRSIGEEHKDQVSSDFPVERLVSECAAGDAKRISRWCVDQVRNDIDRNELDIEALDRKLKDPRLEKFCRLAHYFALLSKDGTRPIIELKDRLFVEWLSKQNAAFEQLVFSGRVSKAGITVLYSLWKEENFNDTTLNLALGASLVADRLPPQTCIAKYLFYRDASIRKLLYPQFDTLEPWEMAILLSGNEDLEDLAWGLDYVNSKNIPFNKASSKFCSWIPYRMKNKDGISVHKGSAFYDHKPTTLAVYLEYGGVCGAVSTAASRFFKAKGVPSYTIGQPGHCAFVYKHTDGTWRIGNNVYGWVWSNGNCAPWGGPISIINSVAKYRNSGMAGKSGLCQQLAELSRSRVNREFLLRAAIELAPTNLMAWRSLLSEKTQKQTEKDRIAIVRQLKTAFADDPYALEVAMTSFLSHIWNKDNKYELCAMLLMEKDNKVSRDIFMRNFVKIAQQDLPELKKEELEYRVKVRGNWFEKWADYHLMNRTTSKARERTIQVIEQVLDLTVAHEQVFSDFVTLYGELLNTWNDDKLNKRAITFIEQKLQENLPPSIGKILVVLQVRLSNCS